MGYAKKSVRIYQITDLNLKLLLSRLPSPRDLGKNAKKFLEKPRSERGRGEREMAAIWNAHKGKRFAGQS